MNTKGKELHFKGKKALDHITQALQKGKKVAEEPHGRELPGHLFAFIDVIKNNAAISMLLFTFHLFYPLPFFFIPAFLFSLTLWQTARSAFWGWSRMERFHRSIEEERWEIEHHRQSEKEELRALYQAKGFEGKLLDDVIGVLMADENRLLQEMLQEELGLPLETMEHPLKQAAGAFVGGLLSLGFFSLLFFYPPLFYVGGFILHALGTIATAKWEKNQISQAFFWATGAVALSVTVFYYTLSLFQPPA